MVLAHYMNSKYFNCIQAVDLTEIGSHVVLAHQLNSKDFDLLRLENVVK